MFLDEWANVSLFSCGAALLLNCHASNIIASTTARAIEIALLCNNQNSPASVEQR
jgi:hypothetical protein